VSIFLIVCICLFLSSSFVKQYVVVMFHSHIIFIAKTTKVLHLIAFDRICFWFYATCTFVMCTQ